MSWTVYKREPNQLGQIARMKHEELEAVSQRYPGIMAEWEEARSTVRNDYLDENGRGFPSFNLDPKVFTFEGQYGFIFPDMFSELMYVVIPVKLSEMQRM